MSDERKAEAGFAGAPWLGHPEIRAQSAPWLRAVQLLIKCGNATAEPIVMKERDPNIMLEPSLSLAPEAAQTLMDDLWHCGIRPTEGSGSAGSLAATQRHLEDMRKLVFDERKAS